jgi:hypothetical protein
MTASRLRGGSRISARDRAPTVNLSKLADLLSKSIEADGAPGVDGLPLASVTDGKVRLNIRSVLGRLLKHPDFATAFAPGNETGFLRDAELPPFGMTAKMGGRLVHGSEAATAKAINALREAISKELDRGLDGFDLSSLVRGELRSALKTMATTIGTNAPELPQLATMVPVQFAEAGRSAVEREKDIGRVLSGIETVDGRDWLKLILSGVERKLQNDNEDQDDIDGIVTAIQNQSTRPGSQIRRFLDFLEDEAMARVRLQVCMRLMSAVAAQSGKDGLKSYVRRVRECFDAFAGAEGESLVLDVGAVYGVANNTEMAEQLRKAMFYGCLPVWAEGSVQLFERRIDPSQNQPTLREVSYRFRVNGDNPSTGKSAFVSRLDRIYSRLLEDPGANDNVKRSLSELVFLYLVVPESINNDNPGSVFGEAATIAAELKANPVGTLTRLHATLVKRSRVMDDLADELIRVLKSKSTSLVTAANRASDKLMVSVHREVVNWPVVKGMSSPNEDILVKPEAGPDTIAWFNHIRVSESSWPGSIASISVETQLQERSLAPAGDSQEVRMGKSLDAPVLPVRLVPYTWSNAESTWSPAVPVLKVLDVGRGVDVEYDLRLLTLKKTKDDEKARSEQFRTAMVAGASLVIYMALWDLVQRLKANTPNLTMTLVRLQHTGKSSNREADANDGNTAIYAVSQAIEKALARELPVKLQGLTTENDARDSIRWKNRGALAALLGGQPVRFEHQGSLDKVAMVTYVTRPCDIHPAFPEADGYLFVSRTYVADSKDGQSELRVDQMLSRLVENRKDFRTPHLILEEIARLRKAGYQHILLLSHHFGNRHIGRAAERHAPHGTLEFLDEAAARFPDVHVYPLRRDVFPATRLRKRLSLESGFEVLRYDAHQKMYTDDALDVLRSLQPIYTFATLHVVGDEGRPQSGFCTYFFDAEHRLSNFNLKEATRANILGTGEAEKVRQSLVSVLRGIHFMESEKPSDKNRLLPVLDPFDWATPTTTAAAGEVEVMSRRGGRSILLSVPAVLAHVTKVLHKEALGNE